MSRCGCNQTCSCVVQACPDGSTSVTGNGSTANPYVICAESVTQVVPLDTPCIDMTVTGDGSVGAPFEISADPIIDPAPGNGLVCGPNGLFAPGDLVTADTPCIALSGDGTVGDPLEATPVIDPDPTNSLVCGPNGLFAPPAPPGAFVPGCGLVTDPGTGVTSTNTPIPWPFACPEQMVGQDIYCSPDDGRLRTVPEKFHVNLEAQLPVVLPLTPVGMLAVSDNVPHPVGGTTDLVVNNPSPCFDMFVSVRVCVQHALVSLNGPGDNNAQFDSTLNVVGTTSPGPGLGGHQRWRMFDSTAPGPALARDIRDTSEACFTTRYIIPAGGTATFTLGAQINIDIAQNMTVQQWFNSMTIIGGNL